MEDLSHYSSLRQKYSKELNKSLAESGTQSRPQTAEKHVSFDFSDQMDLRELRNLRERHNIELERIKTPPCNEEEVVEKVSKKKKKKKKRRHREKVTVDEFILLEKPAIEIEFVEARSFSSSQCSIPYEIEKEKASSKHFSSKRSLYSEASVNSKRSLVEEIEGDYKKARQALEDSFKLDSHKSYENNKASEQNSLKSEIKSHKSSRKHSKNSRVPSEQSKNAPNPQKTSELHSEISQHSPHSTISIQEKHAVPSIEEKSPQASKSHSKIFSNLISKPLSSASNPHEAEIELSIHSEIEDKEPSLKSSVDFTISDQTPFESIKFSADLNQRLNFGQYYERLKKGIFFRLLTPIIQNLGHEDESIKLSSSGEVAQEFSGRYMQKTIDNPLDLKFERKFSEKLEKAEDFSPKSSVRYFRKEFPSDLDMRTSRTQVVEMVKFDESYESRLSAASISNAKVNGLSEFHAVELSLVAEPEMPQDYGQLQREKAVILMKAIDQIGLGLTATNVCFSFFTLKNHCSQLKEKYNKNRLACANYEFNLLKKSIFSWKTQTTYKKKVNSREVRQYIERWKFVKLYHTFQGLKYVCKVHKQWISEVRQHILEGKIQNLFKNWALYVRFRNVKHFLRFRKAKKILSSWKSLVDQRKSRNKSAFVHWYFQLISKSFYALNSYSLSSKEKWVKNIKAQQKYYSTLYAKTFLLWKHSKALERASFIPLRICTKTTLIRKNGNIQEKSLMDIKIIKN